MAEPLRYPQTRKDDTVDVYHGVSVADPYRWLETPVKLGDRNVDDATRSRSAEVRAWVAAENTVTEAYLANIPERDAIRKRLTELWSYERFSAPMKRGGRYYVSRNSGLQNQSVVYVQDTLASEPRVFMDPNTFSADGTVALGGFTPSDDGRYVAYGLASAGSDWIEWRVREIATGEDLPDLLHWTKESSVAWLPDGSGFFYTRYPEPAPGADFLHANLDQRLLFHRIGTAQAEDREVFRRADEPTWVFDGTVTDDGRYLVITIAKGTANKYRVSYVDLHDRAWTVKALISDFADEFTFIGNDGTRFYFKTDRAAPRRRVVSFDIDDGERKLAEDERKLAEVLPETKHQLEYAALFGDRLLAYYLEDAKAKVDLFRLDGTPAGRVDLPGIGTAEGFRGKRTDRETFYTFVTFTQPVSTYRFDFETGKSELLKKPASPFDGAPYIVRQEFYTSKDGTRVPMFLVHRRDLERDGSHPTYLYGYGGFAVPMLPMYSTRFAAWLEMGGIVAVPNLRGGSEYGEEWHLAGTKLRKQNVFDDFIAAAELLIRERYTSTPKLAIAGGSNGGLLVGAVMTQRPELFGACLPAVGVMDMLRFHLFTAGRFWVDDYGSSDNPNEFRALYAYSPYHNLKPAKYPATLVTTADTDDRVVPAHSFKFAARLQEVQRGDAPVLIRVETSAGHGAGTPVSKLIDETTDELAFLVHVLGAAANPR